MQLVAAVICAILSILGYKSLHLFAASNGLLGHLGRLITNGHAPSGQPLRTLTTSGRYPGIDLQLKAVATNLLMYCEDLTQPDVNIVGFSFCASWGPSWMLIVLESLRMYSQSRLMSW